MTYNNERQERTNIKPENFLRYIRNRIRQASDFEGIIALIVTELRLFIGNDRVMMYKFNPDASGQVIAESTNSHRLPSLLGLNFPPDDIPPSAREQYINSRVRSVVNVDTRQIGQSQLAEKYIGEFLDDDVNYHSVDPCHLEYLNAMGVKRSLVVPIVHQDQLWGLLAFHHSEAYVFTNIETDIVQVVAEDLTVAIAQHDFRSEANERVRRDTIINRIANLLHSLSTIEFQSALKEAVEAFSGTGGRLCILDQVVSDQNGAFWSFTKCLEAGSDYVQTYSYGKQPIIPDTSIYPLMEQYKVWPDHYKSKRYNLWAISDIYQTPELQDLQSCFQETKIRGMLMIPLHYRQQLLGYMSIFRDEVDSETLWAGQFDPDSRQMYPRQSFEVWRETKKAQAPEWKGKDIELAQAVGKEFATAIYENQIQQQAYKLSSDLETQVQERTTKLSQVIEQQRILFEVVAKIRESLDLNTIFKTATKEICQHLQADRVAVYRFNADWSGNFVAEFVNGDWVKLVDGGVRKRWEDTYLHETQGGRYREHKTFAVDDIYQAGHAECHIELLEQFQAKAYAIVPIFISEKLWGLLAAYQNSGPRNWKTHEIEFMTQTATQFGVALQQATLITKIQQQRNNYHQLTQEQDLWFEVVTQIRELGNIDTIFKTAIKKVCQLLKTERTAVYRFNPDKIGEFVYDFTTTDHISGNSTIPGTANLWNYSYLQEIQRAGYSNHKAFAVDDIHKVGLSNSDIEALEQFNIKAYAIVPIFVGRKLWGLLAAYQHSQPHQWKTSEIKVLSQAANLFGVTLQQAELIAQNRHMELELQPFQKMQESLGQLDLYLDNDIVGDST